MQNFFDMASIQDAYDVVIIGAGPAGCSAAIYTSRDELSTLVLEQTAPGGQMGVTSHIDNHPGFPETISGMDLTDRYHAQATRFGATLRQGICIDMKLREDGSKEIYIQDRAKPIIAQAVIVATGCAPKKMDVPGESKFWGRGVSTCATCDGGFYKDKVVVAIGGGNTALSESLYLTRFAKKLYLVHRRDEFRGTKIDQRAIETHPCVELVLDSVITEITGDSKVQAVNVKNVKTGAMRNIDTDGVFIFIGQTPLIAPFDKYLKVDKMGYILTNEYMETNMQGVFAAGDIRSKEYRQIAIAIGEAVTAAQRVNHYLRTRKLNTCSIDGKADKA
ncbi:MAG: thioredoxin-disulfide reductase [Deferribacteraceae bacterium]|jgi:thioredoxin reductase (NADPH)|nr:thioredoxin-disulfide reductase [Deferribacteraceae bacterium]